MPDILEQICSKTLEYVAQCKRTRPLDDIIAAAQSPELEKPRGFINALKAKMQSGEAALIAEIKKASPSKGLIRADFNPAELAQSYQNGGAACLSVLTDQPYFQGHDEYLLAARNAVPLPVLRKDFMLEPYQIHESRALGADCILLIVAALSDSALRELYTLSVTLGMDVLIEIHDEAELNRALNLDPAPQSAMIGVNSRNLKTLEVNIDTAFALAEKIPDKYLKVAESGIGSYEDVTALKNAGYQAFLIGESLMRQNDVTLATKKILGKA
ncbi:MAG: indole-3-glycerol phosphate synthase TrpC [Alphaproteobacteria bacterium]